uniref:Uncharacterized protein n=1 Tax=Arundo donax TaxID=35708 RepID=A0A0A9FG38_ARUDO
MPPPPPRLPPPWPSTPCDAEGQEEAARGSWEKTGNAKVQRRESNAAV